MSHTIKLFEAFKLVDKSAPKKKLKEQDSRIRISQDDQPRSDKGKSKGKYRNIDTNGNGHKIPVFLYALHKAEGYR